MSTYRKRPLGGFAGGAAMWSAAAAVAVGLGALALGEKASAQAVDLDQIFWCDESIGPLGDQSPEQCMAARQMVMSSCTTCHTFAPVVLSQYTEQEWQAFMARHHERVPELSAEDLELLTEFLSIRFNPENPPPDLPDVLREYTLPPA